MWKVLLLTICLLTEAVCARRHNPVRRLQIGHHLNPRATPLWGSSVIFDNVAVSLHYCHNQHKAKMNSLNPREFNDFMHTSAQTKLAFNRCLFALIFLKNKAEQMDRVVDMRTVCCESLQERKISLQEFLRKHISP